MQIADLLHCCAARHLFTVWVLDHGCTSPCKRQQQCSCLKKKGLDSSECICQQQGRIVSPLWKYPKVIAWFLKIHHNLVPLAAPLSTIFYSKSRQAVKNLALPSPDFSYPQLPILHHFFYPRDNFTTQHAFTFGWSSFFQHFPRCTEVGAHPCLISALILQM